MTSRRLTRRLRRGQAMVEYSMVSHIILLGGLVVGAAPVFPDTNNNFVSFVGLLMRALTSYYEGLYAVITSPTL